MHTHVCCSNSNVRQKGCHGAGDGDADGDGAEEEAAAKRDSANEPGSLGASLSQ